MPLENVHTEPSRIWGLWKITEDETFLTHGVGHTDLVPDSITNPSKRLEYLAGRLLIKTLLSRWGHSYDGLTKDEYGKPYLKNYSFHMSLSHSYPYVAAVIDKNQIVGIDLEQPKDKLLNIAARVLNAGELQDATHDPVKHCIYWCAKEALIKIYGKKDLTLAKNLAVSPFLLQKKGVLTGSIIANGLHTTIPLYYEVYDNFVVVLNK
jgi:4'-phosphopantetheinyl transferase